MNSHASVHSPPTPSKETKLGLALLISDKIVFKGSLVKGLILGLVQETHKNLLECLVMAESKEMLKTGKQNKTKQKLHKIESRKVRLLLKV